VCSGALDGIFNSADDEAEIVTLRPTVRMGAPVSEIEHLQQEIRAARTGHFCLS
jgi:hypothetical protein